MNNIFELAKPHERIIDLKPLGGSDVKRCIFEALEIVRVIGGMVRFKHNGADLLIDGTTTYKEIYDDWQNQIKLQNQAEP